MHKRNRTRMRIRGCAHFTASPCETLDQLQPGQKVRIKRVGGVGLLRRRLMDMGMVAGVEVEMVKTAPLGDPVEYRLCGYHLSLRKSEARCIEVE